MFSCEGASAKHESRLGAANLAHASPEPASVSIDASADHSTPFHLKPALPGQHQPSEAWGQEVDRRQELERPAANAERAEAADIGQVENEESVAAEDSAEKVRLQACVPEMQAFAAILLLLAAAYATCCGIGCGKLVPFAVVCMQFLVSQEDNWEAKIPCVLHP